MQFRVRHFLRRARADQRGVAALEFGLVALPFFTLFCAILEAALVFFGQSLLQDGTMTVARQIRTGQSQCYSGAGATCKAMTSQDMVNAICSTAGLLLSGCTANLVVDIQANPASSNNALSMANPTGQDTQSMAAGVTASSQVLTDKGNFTLGGACDVMVVRVYYPWKLLTPGFSWFLYNMDGAVMSGGKVTRYDMYHLMTAAAAFRNEPVGVQGC